MMGKWAAAQSPDVAHATYPFYPIESPQSLLDRFGADVMLIKQIFESYCSDAASLLVQLDEAVDGADLLKVRAVLHTLRGTSGTVGASALYHRLGTIEWELMGDNPPALDALLSCQVRVGLKQLLTLCTNTLAAWIDLTLGKTVEAEGLAAVTLSTSGIERWYEALNDILPFLQSGNMQALEMLEGLRPLPSGVDHASCRSFIEQVQALRFNDALITLQSLLREKRG